jgi:pyridinium-3,5-biscarboxylic acid mononucleotide sulfurtransferase
MMADDIATAQARLDAVLDRLGPIAIAVSGGVDSMTLAYLAHQRGGALMVHALSPAVPADATERVRRYAARFGWSSRAPSRNTDCDAH